MTDPTSPPNAAPHCDATDAADSRCIGRRLLLDGRVPGEVVDLEGLWRAVVDEDRRGNLFLRIGLWRTWMFNVDRLLPLLRTYFELQRHVIDGQRSIADAQYRSQELEAEVERHHNHLDREEKRRWYDRVLKLASEGIDVLKLKQIAALSRAGWTAAEIATVLQAMAATKAGATLVMPVTHTPPAYASAAGSPGAASAEGGIAGLEELLRQYGSKASTGDPPAQG